MTSSQFKEKFPHLSHLEGNDLWDAMALHMVKPIEPKEGDNEIVDTITIGDTTVSITKGVQDAFSELIKDAKPLFEDAEFGFFLPK